MPNIKSAIKRVLVNETKNELNKSIKSKIATQTKKFLADVEAKDFEKAEKSYRETVSLLDSAATQCVIHKNCASRRQARLAKILDQAKKN